MAFNLTAILNFQAPGVAQELDKVNQSFDKLKAGGQRVSRGTNQVAGGMKAVGVAGVGLAGGIAYTVKEHMSFEKQMSSVVAKMDDGQENYAALEFSAKSLGASTVYSATEAAAGLDFLATAGYSAKEAMGVLPTILKAAAASNMPLAQTTSIVADSLSQLSPIMGQYGDKTQQAIVLADMMAMTGARTNSEISDLGEALTYGGGAMANLKIPLDQVMGSLGLLANAGIKGSSAGTAMVNMFNKLQDPTEKAHQWLAAMNLSYKDFIDQKTGKLIGVDQIIGKLAFGMKDLGDEFDKGAAISEILGIRGQRAFFAMAAQAEKAPTLFKDLQNSAGSADKMYKIMTDNLWGMTQNMSSALEGVRLEVGKYIAESSGVLNAGNAIIEPIQKLATAFQVLNIPMKDYNQLQKTMGVMEFGKMFSVLNTDIGQFAVGLREGFTEAKQSVVSLGQKIWSFLGLTDGTRESFKNLGQTIGKFATWLAVIGPVVLVVGGAFMFIAPIITSVVGVMNLFIGTCTMIRAVSSLVWGAMTIMRTAFMGSALATQLATWWTNIFGTTSLLTAAKATYLAVQTRVLAVAQAYYGIVMRANIGILNFFGTALMWVAGKLGLTTLATKIVTGAQWLWSAAIAFGNGLLVALRARLVAAAATMMMMKPVQLAIAGAQWLWNVAVTAGTAVMSVFRSGMIMTRIAQVAMLAVTPLLTAAQWAWNAAMTANPIGLVIVGVTALVALLVGAVVYWDNITAAVKRAWTWFTNILAPVGQLWDKLGWGKVVIAALLGPIGMVGAATIELYRNWDKVVATIKSAWEWVKKITTSGIDKISGWFGIKTETQTGKKLSPAEAASKVDKMAGMPATENVTDNKPGMFDKMLSMVGLGGEPEVQSQLPQLPQLPQQPQLSQMPQLPQMPPSPTGQTNEFKYPDFPSTAQVPQVNQMPEMKMPNMSQATQYGQVPQIPQLEQVQQTPATGVPSVPATEPKFKGSKPNLPNVWKPKEKKEKKEKTLGVPSRKETKAALEEDVKFLDQVLNQKFLPTVPEDQPIVSPMMPAPPTMPSPLPTVDQGKPVAQRPDIKPTMPTVTPPPAIAKPATAKANTPGAVTKELGMESAMAGGGQPQIMVNVPAPQVTLGDLTVEVRVEQNAEGTYALVKKAMRHEQNKAGTQIDNVAQERMSQAKHGG